MVHGVRLGNIGHGPGIEVVVLKAYNQGFIKPLKK
jgi:hypothetical protein